MRDAALKRRAPARIWKSSESKGSERTRECRQTKEMMVNGLDVPPKSACFFCPYHSLGHWKAMKAEGGHDWEWAEAVDATVRDHRHGHRLFVHSARRPLDQAVRIPEDHGAKQLEMDLPCDGGVCFV